MDSDFISCKLNETAFFQTVKCPYYGNEINVNDIQQGE